MAFGHNRQMPGPVQSFATGPLTSTLTSSPSPPQRENIPFPANSGTSSWPKLRAMMDGGLEGAQPLRTSPHRLARLFPFPIPSNNPTPMRPLQTLPNHPPSPAPGLPEAPLVRQARPLPRKKVILVPLPAGVPDHIESAYTFFTNDPLETKGQSGRLWGGDWIQCVNSWVEFQGLFQYRVSLYVSNDKKIADTPFRRSGLDTPLRSNQRNLLDGPLLAVHWITSISRDRQPSRQPGGSGGTHSSPFSAFMLTTHRIGSLSPLPKWNGGLWESMGGLVS